MYTASIIRLKRVRPHPNADRLQLADALGYSVIVGLDAQENDLMVLFPSDGRLLERMCLENNLYRKHPETNEEMGGYFEATGRVKQIRLRGAASEAFVCSLSSLDWTGVKPGTLIEGYDFTELGKHTICEKYVTQATKNAGQNNKTSEIQQNALHALNFVKHFDTSQLRHSIYSLPDTAKILVTEKLHGTSGRTGLVKWTKRKWYQSVLKFLRLYTDKYRIVSGSRNVTFNPDKTLQQGGALRYEYHQDFIDTGLYEDEIIYYELVGFNPGGAPIMGSHSLKPLSKSGVPKEEYAEYNQTNMSFSYGCDPLDQWNQSALYVYRITHFGQDLPWDQVEDRCRTLGLKTVPVLGYLDRSPENPNFEPAVFIKEVNNFTLGASSLSTEHFKEGVCLRIERSPISAVYKYKGDLFCILEGIAKNSENYVDPEEAA